MKTYKHIPDAEKLLSKLKFIIDEIHTKEDPAVLTEYRDFFKNNVNIFSRTYVSAYLLKKFLNDKDIVIKNVREKNDKDQSKNNTLNSKYNSNTDSKPQKLENATLDSNNVASETRLTRRISLNVGSDLYTETEIINYVCSAANIDNNDVSFFKQTQKHTVLMFNNKKIKNLLNHVKNNPLNDKKLFVDLRGRY